MRTLKREGIRQQQPTVHKAVQEAGTAVEQIVAARIQKAFRAYRKSHCRLKDAGRFNISIQGHTVTKQTTSTLSFLHSWCNVRARRICMITEGRLKQKRMENQMKLEAKLFLRTQQREEAGVKPGRFLVNTVEGECETISRPSIVWSGKRKLGLQLDRAMDSDEAMGGEGSFRAHSPQEDSRQTGKQTGERDGYSGFDETQFAIWESCFKSHKRYPIRWLKH
ncbi:hypothetical protein V6N11_068864 [Hibiscus sabdariffa]|uniref:Uncharacterized protein n=1 Tax=Hibiscus sabdariffa TaxID=183260 RepID=A0ABR2PB05_9ROSI